MNEFLNELSLVLWHYLVTLTVSFGNLVVTQCLMLLHICIMFARENVDNKIDYCCFLSAVCHVLFKLLRLCCVLGETIGCR